MGTKTTGASRQLDRLFRSGTVAGVTDPQLLEEFITGDDASAAFAFEAIVERHGPMVLRVCRTVLQDVHAAEDAFQATFLVLARKARWIGSSELLGNWLYGVAARTARKARAIAARQRARERQAAVMRTVAVEERPCDQSLDDLELALHEEIGRLPDPYRAAIVVCYLEGLSQAQAAQQLRVTENTIRGRLARARKLLSRRLVRRGVVPSAVLAVLVNSSDAASSLRGAMVQATARAALHFVNPRKAMPGVVSATAEGIANGVLSTMWFNPLGMIAGAMMALGLAGAGAALVSQQPDPANQPHQPPSADVANAAGPAGPAHSKVPALVRDTMFLYQPYTFQGKRDRGGPNAYSWALGATVPLPIYGRNDVIRGETDGKQPTHGESIDTDLVKRLPGAVVRTVPVSKDCMVLAYLPDWNFGGVDNIGVGNNEGGVRTLIDWPAIPADEAASPDRQFLLALYSRQTISHPPAGAIHAFEVLEEWTERTSWKTKPRYSAEPASTYKFEPGDGWKLFDVTGLVRARAKTVRNGHGILLRFLNEDVPGGPVETFSDYKFVSREGADQWASRRPVVLVVKAATPANGRAD